MKKEEKSPKIKKDTAKKDHVYQAVGRRKESSARVKLFITAGGEEVEIKDKKYKSGDIIVNERFISDYFPGEVNKKLYMEPLRVTNSIGRFVVSAHITGGGLSGQRDAFIHGISRAFLLVDTEKNRPILKKHGFLTRDPRAKERRKAGFAQKARARKQSPKR